MNQEIIKIEQEQKDISQQVESLSIVNQTAYEQGASMKITLATFRKKLNLFFDPMVSKSKAAYDEIRGTRDKYLKPTKELESVVLGKLKGYENDMAKKAEEEKRKAEAERQRKIDEENEKRRKEAEEAAKAEAEVIGEEVEPEPIEEATVEDIEEEQPLPTIDKVKGLGIRRTWKARVIDKSKVPLMFMEPDMIKLNALARQSKGDMDISGVEAYED